MIEDLADGARLGQQISCTGARIGDLDRYIGVPPVARALTVLCAAMMMIILDGTIVTVALATIQRDLGFSASRLAWVVNAHLIAFGGLLLLAGRLGDLLGGKQIFIAGLVVFTGASLLCGFSISQPMLITARFVQGTGGALASAVSLGMIIRLFPEPRERSTALGAYSFTGAGGASIGLALGGVLTQALSWRWIFFVNVPIGITAIVAGWFVLSDEPGLGLKAGADTIGAVLVTTGRAPRCFRCGYSGPVMSPGRTPCRR